MSQLEFKSRRVQFGINDGSEKGARLALANVSENATVEGLTSVKEAIERLIPNPIETAALVTTQTILF